MKRGVLPLVASALLAACSGSREDARPAAPPPPLPPLPQAPSVETVDAAPAPGPLFFDARGDRPFTLTARDVDVRQLVHLLAEAAGVAIVLPPNVQGRVDVSFQNVPARQALMYVLEQAGLITPDRSARAPWGPVVFYPLPVNVNYASADVIQARFEVSRELAEFIVRSRVK